VPVTIEEMMRAMKATILLVIAVLTGAQYSQAQRASVKGRIERDRKESGMTPCSDSGARRNPGAILKPLGFKMETGSPVFRRQQRYARPGEKAVGRVVNVDQTTQELTLNVKPCEDEPHNLIFKPPYDHWPVERQCTRNGATEILSFVRQRRGKLKKYKGQ
jgi:hypothetical protein